MAPEVDTDQKDTDGVRSPASLALSQRLARCLDGITNADIAGMTGFSSETVRRYRKGSPPSIEFVILVATFTNTSLTWLLTGRGPRQERDLSAWHLSMSPTSEIVAELGRRLDALQERIDHYA